VRLAVFTSKYPARVSTFFERDMRALIEAGLEVEIFPIYPLDQSLWRYGLNLLSDAVLPRTRVHHLSLGGSLRDARPWSPRRAVTLLRAAAPVVASAARFGLEPLAKSAYVIPKAWAWATQFPDRFDHILAYWGNYAATCAYLFHRLTNPRVPFSMWLHAGTDLYYQPVFLRRKLLYADRIICCCEFNRQFVQQRFADIAPAITAKIHVSYHGLDLRAFPYEPDSRPPHRIIAVGTFARDKGFDYLLRAAAQLTHRGREVEIHLVGDGPEESALRALAARLGLASKTVFHGWLPFDAVRAAMRAATILVHPSAGLGDGLPNVIREAMALGTPVIASDVAGIGEALDGGRCGMLVPTKDVGALAAAIETLLGDPSLRRRYADRARQRTEQLFDLGRNGAVLANVLRSATRLVRDDDGHTRGERSRPRRAGIGAC